METIHIQFLEALKEVKANTSLFVMSDAHRLSETPKFKGKIERFSALEAFILIS